MINKTYLTKIEEIKKAFHTNKYFPSIQLHNFLINFEELKKKVDKSKFEKETNLLSHRLSKAELKLDILEFREFLSKILNKKITNTTFTVYKLEWKDFKILNDDCVEKPGIDIILDFTENWNTESGGQIIYSDGSGENYTMPVLKNSLTIVERKKGVQKFFKYVNNLAGNGKRQFLLLSV
ncbi:hypothetical protein HZA97_09985 [Candidatus Woesearchaeota archaeon]|nr:hypothetical protein [Candidatus Woesearchaeota archaeon]